MDRCCPHCGTVLPIVVDAYCPQYRESLEETNVLAEPPLGPSLSLSLSLSPGLRRNGPFLACYYTLAAAWGVRCVFFWQRSAVDFLFWLALATLLTWWMVFDAARRERPIPMYSRWLVFLFAGFVVPGYVIVTRGWRGVGLVLLHCVGWYLVAAAIAMAGGTILFGDAWWGVLR